MPRLSLFFFSFHQQLQAYHRQNQYETSAKIFLHPIATNDNQRVISIVSLSEYFYRGLGVSRSKSVIEIDIQLYTKYGLSDDKISSIESMINLCKNKRGQILYPCPR